MGRIVRRWLIPLALLGTLMIAGLLFKRVRAVLTILTLFPRWAIALILGLTLVAELVKIARWRFFIRPAGIAIGWRDAATTLLAGQTASLLHGGDLLRIRLAAEHGILPRMGLTISFAMWATDMMALPLLALAGFGKHLVSRWLLFLPLGIPLLLLAVVRSRRFAHLVSRTLQRFRVVRRYALGEAEIEHITHLLTRPAVLAGGVAYAVAMRLLFAAILLCMVNVINDHPLRYETVLSAHALSTLAGSLAFLPGFVSVGSLVELLNARGVPRVLGLLISLTNRLLGVAVNLGVGLAVLLLRYPAVLFGGHDDMALPAREAAPNMGPVRRSPATPAD